LTEVDTVGSRYYQLVLIWVRDTEMFGEYLRLLPPVVARYGGAGDRSFEPTSVQGAGLELPHIVNLVHYDSKEAYQRFNEDPDFQAIAHLRSGSVDLMSFEGRLRRADPSPDGLADRSYLIDVTTRAGDGIDVPGHHTEYELDLEHGADGPDLAVISYRRGAGPGPETGAAAPPHRHIRLAGRIHPAALPSTG
jgi:uncharacterized protein (DUF1330 family)